MSLFPHSVVHQLWLLHKIEMRSLSNCEMVAKKLYLSELDNESPIKLHQFYVAITFAAQHYAEKAISKPLLVYNKTINNHSLADWLTGWFCQPVHTIKFCLLKPIVLCVMMLWAVTAFRSCVACVCVYLCRKSIEIVCHFNWH